MQSYSECASSASQIICRDAFNLAPDQAVQCEAVSNWRQIALDAWNAPSWREAAIQYHKDRRASAPVPSPKGKSLLPSDRDIWRADRRPFTESERRIWRAAGMALRRWKPTEAWDAFSQWSRDQHVDDSIAQTAFATILEKEARHADR